MDSFTPGGRTSWLKTSLPADEIKAYIFTIKHITHARLSLHHIGQQLIFFHKLNKEAV